MNKLKKELGLIQGVGLLSTSLLGTGVFAVPALAALIAGQDSLWAWPLLLLLVFPIALVFAALGRHYPSAGGAAHFVGMAFGPRMGKVTGWLFLSVIPFGLPAGLQIASGFWQAAFGFDSSALLLVQIGTIAAIWLLGLRSARSSADLQTIVVLLIIGLIVAIWWRGGITARQIDWPVLNMASVSPLLAALAVMFWCFVGLEAFAHLATEFRHPERDFPRALIIGLLIAGGVYWSCTVAVLHFAAYSVDSAAAASLPSIVVGLFGRQALWIACIIGYLACFASINIYAQSFARLVWSQAVQQKSTSWLAQLSKQKSPANALTVVLICCLLATVVAYFCQLSLDMLIVYANGIFILVYLLCMLAGFRLLQKEARWMAVLGSLLCLLLFVAVGWKSLYALGVLTIMWLIDPYLHKKVNQR